jgi:hypothetical protein
MKKFFFFVTILLLISSTAMAADYWHFGIGLRAVGVVPRGNDYASAMGEGLVLTFGNPDSRFTTQFEFDDWSVNYHKSNNTITFFGVTGDSATLQTRETKQEYKGLGIGFFEKFRTFEFLPGFSNYIIGGAGGYFLNYKYENTNDPYAGTTIRSSGYHSTIMASGGLGFDGRLNGHVTAFVEGRFISLFKQSKLYPTPDMFQGSLGVKYVF